MRDSRKFATQADFEESIEGVAGYQKKPGAFPTREADRFLSRGRTCPCGCQADRFCSQFTRLPLFHIASGALGYTMQVDEQEHFLMSRKEKE